MNLGTRLDKIYGRQLSINVNKLKGGLNAIKFETMVVEGFTWIKQPQ